MPYHYYEPEALDGCATYNQNEKGNHPHFIRKKRVFSCWAQLYGITFSYPSWTWATLPVGLSGGTKEKWESTQAIS